MIYTTNNTKNANSTKNPSDVDVIIIGGGPAGLTAAIYCGRAGLKPVVAAGSVKEGLLPGGQLMTTTEVENYPGFPDGITGPKLMEKFKAQASRFGAVIVDEWASDIKIPQFEEDPFKLKIGKADYQCKVLIIATGAVAKWLGLPNEDMYKNNGLSACATCDGSLPCFRNAHIHVVGGGDTAMEESLYLTRFASKVTVVHRRDQLRASKVMQERAFKNEKIDFMFNSVVEEYIGDEIKGLQALKIKNLKTGKSEIHPTGGLFMGIGHKPMTEFITTGDTNSGNFGLLTPQGYIKSINNVYTKVEGLFTCGDVHDNHYRQAVTAAGFGCMAAIAAERYLEGLHK